MVEFAYNNTKNTSTSHITFELNCGFHLQVLFEEDVNPHPKSRFANKLANKVRELIKIYYQNLLYAQELQKRAHNKRIKRRSYTSSKKV